MQRSTIAVQASAFPLTFTEGDLRRLCGPAAFRQGDAWQRADHVMGPTVGNDGLSAEVLGTWQRVDLVTVSAAGGRLQSQCSCNGGELCRHAAALLLQWLRDPRSFRAKEQEEPDDVDGAAPQEKEREAETPTAELARLLDTDTMAHLREMARRRGVRVTGRTKQELVQELAAALSQPESVDAALAGLGDDERLVLEALDLIARLRTGPPANIGAAYRALGGSGELTVGVPQSLDALIDLGLAIPSNRMQHPSYDYKVPRAVKARLGLDGDPGPVGRLLHTVDGRKIAGDQMPWEGDDQPQEPQSPKLGMLEVFQVVVHELVEGRIGKQLVKIPKTDKSSLPPGWQLDPEDPSAGAKTGRAWNEQREVRLLPLPPPLAVPDLLRLVNLTGQSLTVIDYALHLMLALGILERPEGRKLVAREDRLQALLILTPVERTPRMAAAWLDMNDAAELRFVARAGGRLQLHYISSPYHYPAWTPQPHGSSVRVFLARLIGRLAATDRADAPWYDFASLLDILWNLSPTLLGDPNAPQQRWFLTDRKRPDRHLNLEQRDDWRRAWGPLVGAILAGPMSWLGLVETAKSRDDRLVFQVRPAAAILVGREVAEPEANSLPSLMVETGRPAGVKLPPANVKLRPAGVKLRPADDEIQPADDELQPAGAELPAGALPTVIVPANTSDGAVHGLLSSIGELVEASPQGLRYRLTPERVRMAFDAGVTGPELIGGLTARAGGSLPDSFRRVLEEWWAGYGTVRLYDELTLIELGDDLLLRELQATGALGDAVIYTFSPRLIAVLPSMVDAIVAQLTRLGYMPRVVEEG